MNAVFTGSLASPVVANLFMPTLAYLFLPARPEHESDSDM